MMLERPENSAFQASSKEAVETAIDIAKANPQGTWEDAVRRNRERIPRWKESPKPSSEDARTTRTRRRG